MFGYLKRLAISEDETSLKDYLSSIFPDEEIIYEKVVPVKIQKARGASSISNFRPHARIESKNLIINLDDFYDYTNVAQIHTDYYQDEFFKHLGYTTVRIPYFVQLNPESIYYFFGVESAITCKYKSGFHSPSKNIFELNPYCPANFSNLGYAKFQVEYAGYPIGIRKEIVSSLMIYIDTYHWTLVIPYVHKEDDDLMRDDLNHYTFSKEELLGYGYEKIFDNPEGECSSNHDHKE